MKKHTHFSFPEVFGITSVKRLAYENPGETEAFALAGIEASKEADIDTMAKEGQKGLDKALADGNAALDRKAGEYKKKYEGKEDADAANKAIDAALATAKAKLAAKHKAAGETLKQNAVSTASETANKLVEDRRKKAKDRYSDTLKDKSVPGDAGFTWSPKGEVGGTETSNEYNSMGSTDFKKALSAMLEAVYIAEGEKAANDLADKMKNQELGFDKMQTDPEFAFGQGTYHDPPLIQFNPDYQDENHNTTKLTGYIFGYRHAAMNRFGDNTEAREAYLSYLASWGKKYGEVEGKGMNIDELKTPDEWVTMPENKDKYLGKTKELDEEQLNKERLAKVNEHVAKMPGSRGWESEQLKGVLLGRLQSEPDPAKWDDIMNELGAKACGIPVDVYKDTSWEDLEKQGKITGISEFVKTQSEAMGKYVLDEGKNHDGKSRGYIAGLMMVAEEKFKDNPNMLKKYKEQLKAVTDSEDFQKKLGENLENSDYYSKRQRDMDWNNPAEVQKNMKELRKLGEANEALFTVAKAELPTPDKYEKDAKEKGEEKAKKSPREAYVDSLLENMRPEEQGKERDTLRGILMASIGPTENKDGSVKTPEEMGKLVKPILEHMGLPMDLRDAKVGVNLYKVMKDRDDFGDHGKKMDHTSKGYYAALIYQAEKQFEGNPKGLEAYKKHLKDELNSESFKGKTEDQIEKLKKYQGYLDDADTLKLTSEQQRSYREKIASLTDELFMETRKATKWPEDFAKEFEKSDKSETMKGNKEFIDKYGTSDKLDAGNSKKSLDAIIAGIPKDKVTDANKKAVEDKKKDLTARLGKATTQDARLKILAEAQDYAAHLADEKASESRYQDAMQTYTVSRDILDNQDKTKSQKYLKTMAKALGYKEDDPAVKKALRAAEDEQDDAKRAAVIADQIVALAKDAPPNDKGEKATTPFNKEDYEVYSAYINEKREQAKAKKKSSTGGGGAPSVGGGGAPAPGGQGGPGAVPPGKKEAPEPDKEKPPEQTPFEQAKSGLVGTLASYIAKMKQFAELGITSPEALTAKVSEEIGKRVSGLDLSKVPDQEISVAGGAATMTIAGGKVTKINVAPWAANIYAKSKEEAEPPKEKEPEPNEKQKQLVAKLSAYAAQHYQAWVESMHSESGVRGKFQQEMSYYVESSGLDLSVLDKPYQVCMYGFVTPQGKAKNVVVSVSKGGVSARTLNA